MPVTINDVRAYKERGERFAMLTAYDAHRRASWTMLGSPSSSRGTASD